MHVSQFSPLGGLRKLIYDSQKYVMEVFNKPSERLTALESSTLKACPRQSSPASETGEIE